MLDERGVEWWPMHDTENGHRDDRDTEFLVYGCKHIAHEWGCRLQVDMLTPEQTIEATLGRGTCRDVAETPQYRDKTRFECSECGYEYSAVGGFGCDYGDEPDFNYCPNCGRKVVSE